MNREQAKIYLRSSGFSEEQIDTIEQAFRQQPCEDTISRQAAIDAINRLSIYNFAYEVRTGWIVRSDAVYELRQLPSVTCSEKPQECEDAISRQDAISIIQNWLNFDTGYSWGEKNVMKCAISELMDLPSVSTEKTGRWIESNGVGMFICSECTEPVYPMPTCMGKPLMRYCPNCGAKMGVEE